MVREKPILFSGEMVKSILAGRKTMTRRIVKPQPDEDGFNRKLDPSNFWYDSSGIKYKCPYGKVGDLLWVRETHYRWTGCGVPPKGFNRDRCYSDNPEFNGMQRGCCLVTIPSIHMPRWASRINLEITGLRVERLQDITEKDVLFEGVRELQQLSYPGELKEHFARLWDSINAKRGDWDSNPWVWVIDFKRLDKL